MKNSLTLILFGILMVAANPLLANNADWYEETMYSSGKINVVVAVVGVILIGIFIYLGLLDRRLRKIEDEQSADENSN